MTFHREGFPIIGRVDFGCRTHLAGFGVFPKLGIGPGLHRGFDASWAHSQFFPNASSSDSSDF